LPYGPVPSKNQMRWQEMEYYAFVHFSVNTYTDMAWGKGDEDPGIFNPSEIRLQAMGKNLQASGNERNYTNCKAP
jgi:alpha-L-fucosidase